MPAPIVIRNLTPETKKAANPEPGEPLIATKADLRDGSRGAAPQGGIIFEEHFDEQPDWTSSMYAPAVTEQNPGSGITFPAGWDAVYQVNAFNRPTIEILSSNSDKTRSGSGKSFVSWKEHYKERENQFASNGTIHKEIVGAEGDGVTQLYAEFWICFDPNWTAEFNLSKMFRVYSWDKAGSIFNHGGGGDTGPIIFWDYQHSSTYGVFNNLTFRGGPWGENYKPNWPASVPHGNQNFQNDMLQQLPDKVNGGIINGDNLVWHDQVFGPLASKLWTKIGIFVKMNSAPGVQDGEFMQWYDDHLILKTTNVPYVGTNTENRMVKWNVVALGGNDYIGGEYPHPIYPNSAEHEEWYAIDDFVIRHDIPDGLETSV